jgi:hypothetical protein
MKGNAITKRMEITMVEIMYKIRSLDKLVT